MRSCPNQALPGVISKDQDWTCSSGDVSRASVLCHDETQGEETCDDCQQVSPHGTNTDVHILQTPPGYGMPDTLESGEDEDNGSPRASSRGFSDEKSSHEQNAR